MSEHVFIAKGSWQGGRSGSGQIHTDALQTQITVPSQLNGQGTGTNPEELLLSSSAACYLITLGILLNKRNLPVKSMTVESLATVTLNPVLRFDQIEHRTHIILQGATPEQVDNAHQLAFLAEENCMVSAALRGNVTFVVSPTIENSPE
jgi:peroxiredoxin-like protein